MGTPHKVQRSRGEKIMNITFATFFVGILIGWFAKEQYENQRTKND